MIIIPHTAGMRILNKTMSLSNLTMAIMQRGKCGINVLKQTLFLVQPRKRERPIRWWTADTCVFLAFNSIAPADPIIGLSDCIFLWEYWDDTVIALRNLYRLLNILFLETFKKEINHKSYQNCTHLEDSKMCLKRLVFLLEMI